MTASLFAPSPDARHPSRPLALARPGALRPVPPQVQPEGLLQVHTAPFRGSFAGVFSQALRSAGLGSRVLVSQFLKGGVEQGPHRTLWLCGRLQWLRPDLASCLFEPATVAVELEAVVDVWDYTRQQLLSGAVDLMVLDELGLAVELGYLPATEVQAALQQRPAHLDVILTGPAMPPWLLAMADQVTELRRG